MRNILGLLIILLVTAGAAFGCYYVYNNILTDGRQRDAVTALSDRTGTEYIIDADTANEIDDLFAIVGAIARDDRGKTGPRLAGLTAAQFHSSPLAGDYSAEESQTLNEEIARVMERPQLRTLVGSNRPLANDKKPRRSPAAAFIIERALLANEDDKLQVFILGPATNLASAILLKPEIADVIHARYLGFWYDPKTQVYDKGEFNTSNDTVALNLLLDNPRLEFTVMTATTSEALQMQRAQLDSLLPPSHRLTRLLKNRWNNFDRWWTDEDPQKLQWTMWDVASLEAWFHPELATLERQPAPAGNLRRDIGVYTSIQPEAMLRAYFDAVRIRLGD